MSTLQGTAAASAWLRFVRMNVLQNVTASGLGDVTASALSLVSVVLLPAVMHAVRADASRLIFDAIVLVANPKDLLDLPTCLPS